MQAVYFAFAFAMIGTLVGWLCGSALLGGGIGLAIAVVIMATAYITMIALFEAFIPGFKRARRNGR